MVEHILMFETCFYHSTVMAKKVKERMDGMVNDIDTEVRSEYLLFNTSLKQFPGQTVIAHFTRLGKLFKDFLMVFLNIVEECRARTLHLANGHLDYPEEGFDGIVRLINQPVCLIGALLFIISNDLLQEGVFVFKTLVNGAFGDAHLFGK